MKIDSHFGPGFCLALLLLARGMHAGSESPAELSSALQDLMHHVRGGAVLSADEISRRTAIIQDNIGCVGSSGQIMTQAFALSVVYEERVGPLFINEATRQGFKRTGDPARDLDRAVFATQQGLIDHAYTPDNLREQFKILDGAAFGTAAYFPGAVDPAPDPAVVHTVQVNASQPACWGAPVMYAEDPARRPTGYYLAPGSIARITVPASMVGKGFSVRVGAHSWDLRKKPHLKRLDRVSIVYPIDSVETLVANPLGGGIYIEVPYEATAGLVPVSIANAVRSPFFSARSFDQTTLEEWRDIERHQPGPWADFESDKFMMQVPSAWIRQFDDPQTLMRDWDIAMDAVSRLFGLPLVRNKSVLYLQVDVLLRGSANFPGYPQSNTPYDPHKLHEGNPDHWLLRGPQYGGATIFHELGHAQLFTKFKGEVEAVVNLPYVAVLNKGFGVDLDTAFGRSFHNDAVTLDQAAIMWMVTENFGQGKPMDISNSERNEVRYQHRGYGKYVEIVHLFGWEVLEQFWHSVQLDYLRDIEYPRNSDPTDNRILRLSKAAGVDLTPLIHFWGVHPEDGDALRTEMALNGLKPSPSIYDRLVRYQTLIPMNNAAFGKHARIVHPKGIHKGKNPLYGEGWYDTWLPQYDETHGQDARASLQAIIDRYFPDGRPM